MEFTTEWGTFDIPAELAEAFAAKDTPQKVGRLAGKLLDTTDYSAGLIDAAKKMRLEEMRQGRVETPDTSAGARIDRHARMNRLRMR